MRSSIFILAGSAFSNLVMAAPVKDGLNHLKPMQQLSKRLSLARDCGGEKQQLLDEAMQGCVKAAQNAASMILNDERYAVAYFNTNDQKQRQEIADRYQTIANECSGKGNVTISCTNVDNVDCNSGTLAVTHWETLNGKTVESNIFFCPNSFSSAKPTPQSCNRDDMTTTLVHEMSHAVFKTKDLFSFKNGGSQCIDDAYSYGYLARAATLKCLDEGKGSEGVGLVNKGYGSSKGSSLGSPSGGDSTPNQPTPAPREPETPKQPEAPKQPETPAPAPQPQPQPTKAIEIPRAKPTATIDIQAPTPEPTQVYGAPKAPSTPTNGGDSNGSNSGPAPSKSPCPSSIAKSGSNGQNGGQPPYAVVSGSSNSSRPHTHHHKKPEGDSNNNSSGSSGSYKTGDNSKSNDSKSVPPKKPCSAKSKSQKH